jgi:tetratricopeptide (TPR) repeat protein
MAPKLKIVGAALAAMLSALAASSGPDAAPAVETRAAERNAYDELIDELDDRIESLQARAIDRPDDWLVRQHLGTALFERAGLTHDFDDYAWLQHVLDEAFAIAPDGSGPMLLAARFEFAVHRLDAAEARLDRIEQRPLARRDDVIAARLLRSQIAFQRGEYEAALAGLTDVAAIVPAVANPELALYHAKTGDPDRADALLVDALTRTRDARRRAWILLQRGLIAMDRGAHLQAQRWLQEADAELPGWWLVQEHLADVHDRLGEHGRALTIYEELVRAHGMPQHMDALAKARKHAGDDADDLATQASTIWDELIALWPEAAMGHGLDHALQVGDVARAVELAEANHRVRAGGEAKVALARAYLAARRPEDALAIARAALATPYRTAALHRVTADAHVALGDTAAAEESLASCRAIDPSCDPRQHTH